MRRFAIVASLVCSLPHLGEDAAARPLFLHVRNRYAAIDATLRLPAAPAKVAIVNGHPWGDSLASFPERELAAQGFAFLSFNTRTVNREDLAPDGIFEKLLLDVAAAVAEMKRRGYQKVLLMGWSAGGPLMSLYQNAAENGNLVFLGDRKLYKFPGFFDRRHAEIRLPRADGIIFINPVDGTSTTFLNRLDGAIVDEYTGRRDPRLDMFNPENGYDPETETANYSREFIARYSRAQAARMNRLIDAALSARTAARAGKGPYTDDALMMVAGTRARLLYTDLHLGDAVSAHLILPEDRMEAPRNDRARGHYSLFGAIPDRNASVKGAIIQTCESFLSVRAVRANFVNPVAVRAEDWGVDIESTNNTTVGNVRHFSVPWVLLSGTADDKMNTAELIYNEAKSRDKTIIFLRGATHGLTSVDSHRFLTTAAIRKMAVARITQWIDVRFRQDQTGMNPKALTIRSGHKSSGSLRR